MSSSTSSSNNEMVYGTPESHVWEIYGGEGSNGMLLNKVTGEVKIIDMTYKILKTLKCKNESGKEIECE